MKKDEVPAGHAFYLVLVEGRPGHWRESYQVIVGEEGNHTVNEVANAWRKEHGEAKGQRVAIVVAPD